MGLGGVSILRGFQVDLAEKSDPVTRNPGMLRWPLQLMLSMTFLLNGTFGIKYQRDQLP